MTATMSRSHSKPWLKLYGERPETLRPKFANMLELFRAAVSSHGNGPAATYFGRSVTYAQIDQLSDALAVWLQNQRTRRGDRVAVAMQNIPQFAIAVLAIWKAGAIAVPLNPMYRPAELAKLLTDFEPSVVICENTITVRMKEAVEAARIPAPVVLETYAGSMAESPDARVVPPSPAESAHDPLLIAVDQHVGASLPVPSIAPSDIAIILYTSGTTGVPKGAMLSHQTLALNAEVSHDWFSVRAGSGILAVAPLFHIIGFEVNFCTALFACGTLVLTYRFEPDTVIAALERERPAFLIGTITGFIALMNRPGVSVDTFKSIESAYSGGAPVPASVVREARDKLGIDIRTAYGMTETAAPAHVTPRERDIPIHSPSGALAVGIPVSSLDAMIVGEDGNEVANGEAGELWVNGPQVMAGYWRKPKETAEVLNDGWLRTGDVAIMDEAGWFYLVDRKKDMICASGFKVWPREVEDTLYGHPAVREVAVVGVPDDYRGEDVKAFVALKADCSATSQELRDFCRARLAAYKCPHHIEFLPDLPKTVSGKIQRVALRERTPK